MKKIENIIDSCYQCKYCVKLKGEGHTTAFICDYGDDNKDFTPFLLDLDHTAGSNRLDIPDSCPLETYNN
jgi:hypothetical protein